MANFGNSYLKGLRIGNRIDIQSWNAGIIKKDLKIKSTWKIGIIYNFAFLACQNCLLLSAEFQIERLLPICNN